MKLVNVKIGKMRKPDSCVVYPETREGERIFIQGERLVALIDPKTGEAVINHNTGSSYPTSWHLAKSHPKTYSATFPEDLLNEIKAAMPKSGDKIGGGVYIA